VRRQKLSESGKKKKKPMERKREEAVVKGHSAGTRVGGARRNNTITPPNEFNHTGTFPKGSSQKVEKMGEKKSALRALLKRGYLEGSPVKASVRSNGQEWIVPTGKKGTSQSGREKVKSRIVLVVGKKQTIEPFAWVESGLGGGEEIQSYEPISRSWREEEGESSGKGSPPRGQRGTKNIRYARGKKKY